PRHGRLEVLRVHVRLAGGAVPEGFEQHKLVGRVDASRPFKEDIARLGACGGSEGGDTREPLFRNVRTDGELDGDEDHGCSLHINRCFGCVLKVEMCRARKSISLYRKGSKPSDFSRYRNCENATHARHTIPYIVINSFGFVEEPWENDESRNA